MARVAVFCGPALRRNLDPATSKELQYEFFPLSALGRSADLRSFDAAFLELAPRTGAAAIRTLRRLLADKLVASIGIRTDPQVLKRSITLGFDFHLTSAIKGTPVAAEV